MSHLTLVPQVSAPPAPTAGAPHPTESTVERALSLAFEGRRHSLADLYGVHPIAARLPIGETSEADLVPTFRGYLDAAAKLRAKGVPVTIEALFAELTIARRE